MEIARRLLENGLWAPAVVWTVRSVEIFFKEFLLAPSYLTDVDGNWSKAVTRASRLFGSSEWVKAFRRIDEVYGPIAPMLMEDGSDAYRYWHGPIVRFRGEIVHGASDADEKDARPVYAYAEQLMLQIKLRMITGGIHPLRDEFMSAYRVAFAAYHGGKSSDVSDDERGD